MSSQRPSNPAPVLLDRYRAVRAATAKLAEPLAPEDCVAQSMADASPVKWHLAHTTWFYETFILESRPEYRPLDPRFRMLFNSYYQAVGERWTRAKRGLLTRPNLAEVLAYRRHVDAAMAELLCGRLNEEQLNRVELGLQHEQQHQELILTDVKHLLAQNPLRPTYTQAPTGVASPRPGSSAQWCRFPEQIIEVGHGDSGFAFDNETPRHRVLIPPHEMCSDLVTCGEFQAFIDDGGYQQPQWWLSDGWAVKESQGWSAPLYWEGDTGQWEQFTLTGYRPVDPAEPVTHVSYYEADAFTRWVKARLPTEFEWEAAAAQQPLAGHFVEGGLYHPAAQVAADDRGSFSGLFGDVWQWTGSAYLAYPGYRPPPGALGEYNGKFMCNQFVLRGASCATPRSQARLTYRNFFPPEARWQFTGIRLARSV